MPELTWQFDENRTGERDGFHDTGVSHFTGNRIDSLVREVIQNSLDARHDIDRPVIVKFNRDRVKRRLIDAKHLLRSILDSVASPDIDDRDKDSFKETALALLKGKNKSVYSLRIEDSNTTGAPDTNVNRLIDDDTEPTMWQALTKGSGLNVKKTSDAGGSFGVGKFAAFAASDIRTVLYSTSWRDTPDSGLRHRFIGKTILVSRMDGKSRKKLRGVGYLAQPNFEPAKEDEVPPRFIRSEPGTTLWVMKRLESKWGEQVCRRVVAHFYHAIIHRGLDAMIDRVKIDGHNILEFVGADNSKLREFILVSKRGPVEKIHIEGIGEVKLRLDVYRDDRTRKERNIALVRDAGMMITDNRRDMGIPRIHRLPSSWYGFTAVLECLSGGDSSLLRDCESPQHNKISVEEISDEGKRKEARRRLRELGDWLHCVLRKYVEPDVRGNTENIAELAQYLHLVPENEDTLDAVPHDDGTFFAISSIRQQDHRPPGSTRPPRSPKPPGGTGGYGQNEPSGGNGSGKKRRPRGRRGSRRSSNVAFPNIRFVASDHPHELEVSFENPGNKLTGIGLTVVGEDGQERKMKISRISDSSGKSIGVDRKTGLSNAIASDEDKIILKMRLLEPVANKTFNLIEQNG